MAGLAEMEADRKLWAEADKDIRLTSRGAFSDAIRSVFFEFLVQSGEGGRGVTGAKKTNCDTCCWGRGWAERFVSSRGESKRVLKSEPPLIETAPGQAWPLYATRVHLYAMTSFYIRGLLSGSAG